MKNQLGAHIDKWYEIGASDTVIDWLKHGVLFPLKDQIEPFELYNNSFSKAESDFIRTELQALLLLGHIELCEEKPYCVSPIKCIPKKKGDFRLITDLRYVHAKCTPLKFNQSAEGAAGLGIIRSNKVGETE